MQYERPSKPETGGNYSGFDHISFYVGNALQAADWYCLRFGFSPYAYAGLETGERNVVCHAVKQNDIIFVFKSALQPTGKESEEIGNHIKLHGDGVKDVAFKVDNCRGMFAEAVKRGAKVVREPYEVSDANGSVVLATIQTYGETTHTFVQRDAFRGAFLPNFVSAESMEFPLMSKLGGGPGLQFIDHVVGNQDDDQMTPVAEWYEKVLQFHRFWSVDDTMVHTEFSSLRSIVMCDYDRKIKMPINEPAEGKRKSQIKEYVDFYGTAGVQHIALNTNDVIAAVENAKARGVRFLDIPATYYKNLRERLKKSPTQVKESLDKIEELNILVDFDDNGYLLQLFTKPIQDRPTLFIEFIQRANHDGFGAGNFSALFEAIEKTQEERGNL